MCHGFIKYFLSILSSAADVEYYTHTMPLLALLTCVSFLLHLAWEWAHLPLYTGYEGVGGGTPIVLFATLGDVAYTLIAVLVVSLFKGRLEWLRHARPADYIGLGILGFGIALLVEYKALALHRWAYTAAMPIIFGVGLSPLLQMTLLLPFSVFIAQLLAARTR